MHHKVCQNTQSDKRKSISLQMSIALQAKGTKFIAFQEANSVMPIVVLS